LGEEIKDDEMGTVCGTHRVEDKSTQGYGGETQIKEITWVTGCRGEDDIIKDLGEMWWGGMDWIHLAQDRGR
jgi:hypothetical protein